MAELGVLRLDVGREPRCPQRFRRERSDGRDHHALEPGPQPFDMPRAQAPAQVSDLNAVVKSALAVAAGDALDRAWRARGSSGKPKRTS